MIVHEHHHDQPQTEQYAETYESPFALKRLELGATAQPLLNGGVFGLNLLVDWTRAGMDLRYDEPRLERGRRGLRSHPDVRRDRHLRADRR